MTDVETVSEEVVVYGDAPDDSPETGTDTISIPLDMYTFYGPGGTVRLPPDIQPPGGGGSDLPDPKEEFEEAGTKATWIAAGFTVVALIPGVGQAVVIGAGLMAVVFGLGAYHLGQAAGDPPNPDYQRPAGSTIPVRRLRPTGTRLVDQVLQRAAGVERSTAVFVDAAECLQGALIAGDATWTARHAVAARDAYSATGGALRNLDELLPKAVEPLRAHPKAGAPAPPNLAAAVDKVIADAAPTLGLTPADRAAAASVLEPAVGRGIPTDLELTAAVKALRRLGDRLVGAPLVDTRFVFVHGRPS